MKEEEKRKKLRAVWYQMKSRCYNPKNYGYKTYGKRGIKVCERWLDFESFYKDMVGGYRFGLSIDRIDNNKNYEPSNCKWSTRLEQTNNKSNSIFVTYQDQKLTIGQLARLVQVEYHRLHAHIVKQGKSPEEAIDYIVKHPLKPKRNYRFYFENNQLIKEEIN